MCLKKIIGITLILSLIGAACWFYRNATINKNRANFDATYPE